ncbi:PGBD4, partial [Cordylochernes scorpioides]
MPSRKTMPKTEFSQKLKRGEIIKMRRKHLLAIKWKDVRDVFMLSTVHEGKMMPVKPKTPTREELFKPDAVIDYNKGKQGWVSALSFPPFWKEFSYGDILDRILPTGSSRAVCQLCPVSSHQPKESQVHPAGHDPAGLLWLAPLPGGQEVNPAAASDAQGTVPTLQ